MPQVGAEQTGERAYPYAMEVHKEESCSTAAWRWDTASVGTASPIPPCGAPGAW